MHAELDRLHQDQDELYLSFRRISSSEYTHSRLFSGGTIDTNYGYGVALKVISVDIQAIRNMSVSLTRRPPRAQDYR